MRNDVGIVYAPSGPYAIAILSRQVPRDFDADPLIAEISHTIYESFLGM